MKKRTKSKSLLFTMIGEFFIAFMVASIITILIIIFTVSYSFQSHLDYLATPFADYEEQFKEGLFSQIDIESVLGEGSYFIVYEDNQIIYATGGSDVAFNQEMLRFIPDDNYVEIKTIDLENGDCLIEYKDNEDQVLESIVYNKERLIYSSIDFRSSKISDDQKSLILGFYNNYKVRKQTYMYADKTHTVVFFIKHHSGSVIDDEISKILIFIISIILGVSIVMLYVYLVRVNNKVTKPLNELNSIVEAFKIGKPLEISYSGPYEFEALFKSFEKMSSKLIELEQEKIDANKDKQRILADISHDLKTPIAVVKSYAQAINSDLVNDLDKMTYLKVISNNVDKLSDLIDEFSDYNKLEMPEFKLSLKVVNPYEFIREYFIARYDEVTMLGFEMVISIPEKYTEALIDDFQMKKVFDNIISNTIKYNDKDTKIYIEVLESENHICFKIGDDGVGIPDEIRENVFMPFVIGDKARSEGKGSGLGLSIAKKIIDLHNGSIHLKSKLETSLSIEYEIILPKHSKANE